jgi:urease accessory protein
VVLVTATPIEHQSQLLRLLQLVSPSLPVGAFAYSQGLEWAVEAGWVSAEATLEGWLSDQLDNALAWVDLPLLARMMEAAVDRDPTAVSAWIDELMAMRETAELRAEESGRGRALAELLDSLGVLADGSAEHQPTPVAQQATVWKPVLSRSQLAGFAFAAARWNINTSDALIGYAWSWAENLTLAGVKLVPLGQTAGQRVLLRVADQIPDAVERSLSLEDAEIGAASPALAIASSLHETQYTRLFRS